MTHGEILSGRSRGICARLVWRGQGESHEKLGCEMSREQSGGIDAGCRVERRLERLPGAERCGKAPFGLVEAHHLDAGGEPLHQQMDWRGMEIERGKRGIVALQ